MVGGLAMFTLSMGFLLEHGPFYCSQPPSTTSVESLEKLKDENPAGKSLGTEKVVP